MARKSKAFGEILKQERAATIQEKRLEQLQQKLQKGPFGDQVAGVVNNPKGEVKMSEVLEAFVDPYLPSIRTPIQRHRLFEVAVVVWNLSLMPENERQPMIDNFIDEGLKESDPLIQQDTRMIINSLMTRKHKLFADNTRFILDFDLQDTGNTFHLSVASTFSNPFDPDSDD
ncbi:hypothetical protein [Oscillatoria acuminata]|uniref:Uncharacterized protein n=1 Tax=Oscillatoria acuminata PCC 6304 TaxID=56110 RepID=K9TQZ7_9CYAN|nr:hypothetical protein [Oscillatoria acuminata]AFY84990.1 hypothetical protein Oscil6304_5506 [Oscillatoria acuminata PCC 6304]